MKPRTIISMPMDDTHSAVECSECGPVGVSLACEVVKDFLHHFNTVHHLGAAPV